eukprot:TRINITY_DN6522_c0_g1_i4.p1 TRINITY_DN6522_c0_g1~~TRINITY_DN6522_c0_g1_i4.p1  ORF type:complete len:194 (+),score=27.39 TRINITY_DN6522_c0_g1_i4:163-744(+)
MIIKALKPIFRPYLATLHFNLYNPRLLFPALRTFSGTFKQILEANTSDEYLTLLDKCVLNGSSQVSPFYASYLALCLTSFQVKDERINSLCKVLLDNVGKMTFTEYTSALYSISNFFKNKTARLTLSQREYLISPIIDKDFDLEKAPEALPEVIMGIGNLFSPDESSKSIKAMDIATESFGSLSFTFHSQEDH